MGDTSTDLLVPNFGFGFDDNDFSDRVLRIEIVPEDSLGPIIKKSQSAHSDDPNCSNGIKVKSLNVSSIILAQKSPFFYKLFKNGMKESQNKDVTMRINSSENRSLMELLSFMYTNTLTKTKSSDLVDILLVADKYEVMSCMRYCIKLLLKTPMTLDSALSYLELPSTVRADKVVQQLIHASQQYLVTHYKEFSKLQEEATNLPIYAIKVILGSDALRVDSEDDVFEFALEWARAHYPNMKERQEIFTKVMMQCIRFQYMSCSKLKEVLVCPDFDHKKVDKLVMDALFFKIETPNGLTRTKCGFAGRPYNKGIVKVVHLDFPCPRCVVYFDLKKQELQDLSPSESYYSQPFVLGGRSFYLLVHRQNEARLSNSHIGLYVSLAEGSNACTLDFTFRVIAKSASNKFKSLSRDVYSDIVTKEGLGWSNFFIVSWTTFMGDKSEYFIDGILHIQGELTIINSQA